MLHYKRYWYQPGDIEAWISDEKTINNTNLLVLNIKDDIFIRTYKRPFKTFLDFNR